MEDGSRHRSQSFDRRNDESLLSVIDCGDTTDRSNRDAGSDYSCGISGKSSATVSTAESGSGGNTPPGIRNSVSRLGPSAECRELEVSNPKDDGLRWEWLLGFGRNVGTDRLTDSVADHHVENGITSPSSRQADALELELQMLRKQIVKETKRSRNFSTQVERLSKEKDILEKELERVNNTRILSQEGKNPEHVIEELMRELCHEKNTNSSLQLQFSKMQESNEELVLAVKDLDEMLKRKDEEMSRKAGPHWDEDGDIYSQMEQLALDYEILRQENHEMSCKLEQTRLQEQLKMHYDCFSCAPMVYELENQIETLEKDLEKKSKEIERQSSEKIEQEKRAVQAENELRKMRSKYTNVAAKLQEEFRVLSEQMVLTFEANEIAAAKAVTEASRLHLEMSSIKDSYETKLRENADQIEQMKLEIGEKSSQVEEQTREIVSMKSEISRLASENELVDSIEALKNKIERLEEKTSSLRSTNNEKDQTIEALKSQLRNHRSNHGETTISAREHGPDKEPSRKRATKIKEIYPSARMAEKKLSNRIAASDKGKTTHHRNEVTKKEPPIATSSTGDAVIKVVESSISDAGGSQLDDTIRESAILREENRSMEHELKVLQERYTVMSLKFAEVEGDRQRLAMTVQNLAHTKKQLRNRSGS